MCCIVKVERDLALRSTIWYVQWVDGSVREMRITDQEMRRMNIGHLSCADIMRAVGEKIKKQ